MRATYRQWKTRKRWPRRSTNWSNARGKPSVQAGSASGRLCITPATGRRQHHARYTTPPTPRPQTRADYRSRASSVLLYANELGFSGRFLLVGGSLCRRLIARGRVIGVQIGRHAVADARLLASTRLLIGG